MTTQDNVTAMVRYAIAARGESQRAIAAVLGIASSGVADRMTGRVTWRLDELDKLADHFGVSVSDLVTPPLPALAPRRIKPVIAVSRGASVTHKYPRHSNCRAVGRRLAVVAA